jgi:small subunit ribosomal protein S9
MVKEQEETKTKKGAAPKQRAPKAERKHDAKVEAKTETAKVEAKAEAHKIEANAHHKVEAKTEKAHEPKTEAHAKAEPAKHEAPKIDAPLMHEPKAKAEPKAKKKKAPKKEAKKVFVVRGKRKESIARATISAGKGVVRVNSLNVSSINNHYIREIIVEPLRYIGPEANNVDISITIRGGGVMGQAQAARTAIANALAKYFDGMNLREKFLAIDKSLIIEDTRRVETKKFRGPKARARFQKSYR